MIAKKAGGAPGAAQDQGATPEAPAAGGSYLRQPDGTLQRIAFTAMATEAVDPSVPPLAASDAAGPVERA